VALTAPVPRPPHRFWRCESRWMTISRHPGSCAGPLPSLAVRPTRDCTFRSTRPPTVSPADLRSELGPRSLDPDRSFWSAFAELIRGQTSPTDFCNCNYNVRATEPELFNPRRDGDLDLLPFLRRATPSPLRKRWHTASRAPFARPDPSAGFLSVTRVCPTVMPNRTPHLRGLAPAEHSED